MMPALVLQRVPVPQSPIVPLKPSQELQLPLIPGGDPIRFGRGSDCDVRTDGPGVQAELSLDAVGAEMTLTFRGTMPAPGARTLPALSRVVDSQKHGEGPGGGRDARQDRESAFQWATS